MSNCMVNCKHCKANRIGIRTGLSGIGHLFNLVLVFLTGLLYLPVYILIVLVAGNTRCTVCGSISIL